MIPPSPSWFGDVCLIFVSLLIQGLPFLLIGSLAAAVVTVYLPLPSLLRLWPQHPLASVIAAAGMGLFTPSCDCAVVPVVRRALQKGLPQSAGITYLLAAPTLNPLCLISTFLAFQLTSPWRMVVLRAAGAAIIAVTVGLIAGRISPARWLKGEVLLALSGDDLPSPWMEIAPGLSAKRRRLGTALGLAITDFINVSTLYVIGTLCSAFLQTVLPLGPILHAHKELGVPMALLLAFLFGLCSSADAFVVVAFGALGLSGQLSFLWLGPIFGIRTLFVYRNLFQYRAIAGLGLAIVLLISVMAPLLSK